MSSKIFTVLKNKNKIDKMDKKRKQDEIETLRIETSYRAKLYDNLAQVNKILNDTNVESVLIRIPKQYMGNFLKSLYTEDMAEYENEQVSDNEFVLRYKIIDFN